MPQGLQTMDASGNVILDTSMRLGRVLGVATLTAPTGGSAVNAAFADGAPFWMVTNVSTPNGEQPTISVAGTTISWSFPGVGSGSTFRLVYGVY
jgi:hypothetical protein